MYPVNISFSRKQIAQVVGTTDDVLGYWMREGLLVPTSGGSGKGSHRSFDYRQVHTAAILHELRGLGVNIAGLKWFASTIQRGITLADSLNASGRELLYASYLAKDLQKFAAGEKVRVSIDGRPRRAAVNELEIIDNQYLRREFPGRDSEVVAIARRLSKADILSAQIYADILNNEHLLERGEAGSKAKEWGEFVWACIPASDGSWKIIGTEGMDISVSVSGARSWVSLAVSLIIRRLWQPA